MLVKDLVMAIQMVLIKGRALVFSGILAVVSKRPHDATLNKADGLKDTC